METVVVTDFSGMATAVIDYQDGMNRVYGDTTGVYQDSSAQGNWKYIRNGHETDNSIPIVEPYSNLEVIPDPSVFWGNDQVRWHTWQQQPTIISIPDGIPGLAVNGSIDARPDPVSVAQPVVVKESSRPLEEPKRKLILC